jgi:hypothetical protein
MSKTGRMMTFLAGHPLHQGTGGGEPTRRKVNPAQAELDEIFKATPPGSAGYRTSAVQNRVRQLNEFIHGNEPAIGTGGRTA